MTTIERTINERCQGCPHPVNALGPRVVDRGGSWHIECWGAANNKSKK